MKQFETDLLDLGFPLTVEIENYRPARPGRLYLPNGDPGYPDEPEEIEFEVYDEDGHMLDLSTADRETLEEEALKHMRGLREDLRTDAMVRRMEMRRGA